MSRFLFALALAALSLSAQAGEQRDAVLDLLNAVEQPPTRADLEAIPGVDAELMAIADDGKVAVSRRGRAISALGFFPNDATRAFVEGKLAKADKDLLRRKAAGALGLGWGEDAVATLAPYLGESDAQLRMAVARALGSIGGDAAKAALQARLEQETDTAVKQVLTDALSAEVAQ